MTNRGVLTRAMTNVLVTTSMNDTDRPGQIQSTLPREQMVCLVSQPELPCLDVQLSAVHTMAVNVQTLVTM